MRISHVIVIAAGIVACQVALSQPKRSVELTFSGTTSASQLLIQDVVRNVMEVGGDELNCSRPDEVIAEALPEDFAPPTPDPAPEGASEPIYERWTVSFCGNQVPFLLTFWNLEQGGTAFDLDYPFIERVSETDDGATRLQ